MPGVWMPTLRLYFRDYWIRLLFAVAIFLNFVVLFLVGWYQPDTERVLLHYNVYFGIDLIGEVVALWWLPCLAAILIVMNATIALHVWRRDRVLSYFVAGGTVFCVAIIAVATSFILLINNQ